MLNFIAVGITAYLLANNFRNEAVTLQAETEPLPASGRLPSHERPPGEDRHRPPASRLHRLPALRHRRRHRLLRDHLPHPLRLRPADLGQEPERRPLLGREPEGDDPEDDDPLGRDRRPGRHVAAHDRVLQVRRHLPDAASASPASPWPCSGATARRASPSRPSCGPASSGPRRTSRSVGVPQEIGQILQGTLLLSAVIAFEVVRRYRPALVVKEAADKTAAERVGPRCPTGAVS